jgi:hypothetical protein
MLLTIKYPASKAKRKAPTPYIVLINETRAISFCCNDLFRSSSWIWNSLRSKLYWLTRLFASLSFSILNILSRNRKLSASSKFPRP